MQISPASLLGAVRQANRVCISDPGTEVEESSGEDGGSSGGTWFVDWWRRQAYPVVRGFLELADNTQVTSSGALGRSTGHRPIQIQELVLAREWRFESSLGHH
jgi:hypothetical protein